jgi:hypothetical protein
MFTLSCPPDTKGQTRNLVDYRGSGVSVDS